MFRPTKPAPDAPRPRTGSSLWLIVAASTCASLANGAVTPLLPLFVTDVLHGDAVAAGALVGLAPFVGLLSQPLIGWLADRHGYLTTWVLSLLLGIAGILAMLGAGSFALAAGSRALFGITSAAANTVMAAWVIATVAPEQRGRGLGLFGVSVWIGLGAGPQLGQVVVDRAGYRGLWILSAALLAAALVLAVPLPRPAIVPQGRPETGAATWRESFRSVLVPGTVAGLAWSAEGVILGFLIVHLRSRGLAADGLFGPTSVLTVFAVTVIVARFLFSSVTDRLGPLRTTTASLALLAGALVTLAFATTFAVAALAAVALGLAFAPLYPALTLLANEHLTARNRGTGLGIFSALTALGTTVGTLYGGLLSGWRGATLAFLTAAALQVVALGVVLATRRLRTH
jgi:MFS family permease